MEVFIKRTRPIASVLFFLFMIFLAIQPLTAKVSRTSSRVLSVPGDIVTSRKANFKIGDILTTPMISLTIVNDPTPAYLLLVLELSIDSPEIPATENTATAEIVRQFATNETLTFTNTDLMNYVGNVRGGSAPTAIRDAFGVSSLSSITDDFFKNTNQSIPEGEYTLTLKAYEIANENDAVATGTSLKEAQSVTFKVITVGSIVVLEKPTAGSLLFKFQLPQTPYYSDSSISTVSTTKVTIKGTSLEQTLSKSHSRVSASLGSTLKGYPSDTTDGEVVYDLSAIEFRAGKPYTLTIEYTDASGYQIASTTSTVTFATPRFYTDIDTTNPFKPEFSWSFNDDYQSWASEYRIYLNGQYYGYTRSDSYVLTTSLLPNTAYSWYVMPINKDGTPFFDSASSITKSYTTKTHTELDIEIDEPINHGVLLTGYAYDFTGIPTFSDEAEQKSAQWRIGSDVKTGTSVSYTPTKRYGSNSLLAYLNIIDTFNLSKNSASIYLTVLDPAIAIQGGTERTVAKDSSATLAIDTQNSRDLETVTWFIDGTSVGEGTSITHTFDESGTYEIEAQGISASDIQGNTKEVTSKVQTITVIGDAPSVAITNPSSEVNIVSGKPLLISATAEADNEIQNIVWTYAGPTSGTLAQGSEQVQFSATAAGAYTISVTVTDIHQKASTASTRVVVVNPQIALSSPQNNTTYSLSSSLQLQATAPNAERITYFVGNTELSSPNINLADLGVGTYIVFARAFWDVVDINGNSSQFAKDSSQVSISVKDLQPPVVSIAFPEEGVTLKTGTSYQLQASATSNSQITSSWWEVDGTRLTSNTYRPATSSQKKSLTFTYYAMNQDGVRGSQKVRVQLANPSAYLSIPDTTLFLPGQTIPISASSIDSELYWLVDGQEVQNWNKTISNTGTHTIQAGWRLDAMDENGREKTYTGLSSNKANITVYSNQVPTITSFSPAAAVVYQRSGAPIVFSVQASSSNQLETTKWNIYSEGNSIRETLAASISHQSWSPGLYTVQAEVKDIHKQATTHEWTVKIIDPSVTITYPQEGMRFPLNQIPNPVIETKDVSSYAMTLNGTPITSQFNWNSLKAGLYTLIVTGKYQITGTSSEQSTSEKRVSFRVEDRTPPVFEVSGISNNDRFVAGLSYHLVADGQANETFKWLINNQVRSEGEAFIFNPKADDKSMIITVRGERNSIIVDKNFSIRIVDPYISIEIPSNLAFEKLYAPNIPIPLLYKGRDIDKVEWRIDMKPYSNPTVTFTQGMHSIDVDGFATGVRLPDGTLGDYLPVNTDGITGRDIQVADQQGVVSITAPDAQNEGQSFTIEATMAAQGLVDLVDSLSFAIDGVTYASSKRPVTKSYTVATLAAGTHTISATTKDVFGNTKYAEKIINVYKPLEFSITNPVEGQRLSPQAQLTGSLSLQSGSIDLITWRIDNKVVPNSNATTVALGSIPSGRHTITASAQDKMGNVVSKQVRVEVQSDFQLNLLSPTDATSTLIGKEITCLVGVEKVTGSTFDLSDAAKKISWYVNGNNTSSTGLSYQFKGDKAGNYTIQARYNDGSMSRVSSERTITVRDIADPRILQPLSDQIISYTQESSISLSAEGEKGAIYQWFINGDVIAIGQQTSFQPKGLTGHVQLTLVTSLAGRSRERMVSFTLQQNQKPTLTLSVPPLQYTDDALVWSASAYDAEDKNSSPSISFTLDGIALQAHSTRMLTNADIGTHILQAKVQDSMSETTTQRASFEVVKTNIPLQILSPKEGNTYFSDTEIPLIASLETAESGSYTWKVRYLDNPDASEQAFADANTTFKPSGTGEVEVTATFIDANNRERAKKRFIIKVENTPMKLAINWPHGSIVNAGTSLHPSVLGLKENTNTGSVTWYLNGLVQNDMNNLKAPEQAGPYTLVASYQEGQNSDQASVEFTVNARPKPTITGLNENPAFEMGNPIVLGAVITDDENFNGTVRWTDGTGSLLGEGLTLAYSPASIGEKTIIVTATDAKGAQGSTSATLLVYELIKDVIVSLNNNIPTYLINQNSPPLGLRASFTGGVNAEVNWKIKQGNKQMEKKGKEIYLAYGEIAQLEAGPMIVSMTISDPNGSKQVIQKDIALTLTTQATLQILSPNTEEIHRLGEVIPVQIALAGFSQPVLQLMIGDTVVPTSWMFGDGNLTATTQLASQVFSSEGIYELTVLANGNGLNAKASISLNLYPDRSGIFIDDAPEQYQLGTSDVIIHASVIGVPGVDSVVWKNDITAEAVATGFALDLSQANLTAGSHTIMAEAYAGSNLVASTSILLNVIGSAEVNIVDPQPLIILGQGAQGTLVATGRDKDGSLLTDNAFSWSSHVDGIIGDGATLTYERLLKLTATEHMLTVSAVTADGSVATAVQRVQIIAVQTTETTTENQAGQTSGQGEDQNQAGNGPTEQIPEGPPEYFDMGVPIDPYMPPMYPDPFGPGMGGAPDPGLGSYMDSFMGGYGGGFGGPMGFGGGFGMMW